MTTLRRRMMEDMQVRSLSPQTQATYVQQVSLFARHFNRSPELLGPEEIRSYQVYLTNERKLAPSSISIAISALRFLYRITLHKDWSLTEVIPTPKKPQKLPIVPSPEEVLQFLGCVWNIKHRTILTICYAARLRVSEAVCLKVRDIDSERMVIRVEQGITCSSTKLRLPLSQRGCKRSIRSAAEPEYYSAERRRRQNAWYLSPPPIVKMLCLAPARCGL
jgi:integrase/recombinase XerD